MGAWGTGISSNDTYADLYAIFFEQYDNGLEPADISKEMIASNKVTIEDPDDCNNFWFALAKCQWDCKQLDPKLLSRVRDIILSGLDIEVWRRLGADEKDISKRKAALDKFLVKLESERPTAKPRKKKIIRQPIFDAGTCLTFELTNGNYGGVFVLASVPYDRIGFNLLALTRINKVEKPDISDFRDAKILVRNYAGWKDVPSLGWHIHSQYKKDADLFEVVGKIGISAEYHPNVGNFGIQGGWREWTIDIANEQFESEKTKPAPKEEIPLKKLIKRSGWKFW